LRERGKDGEGEEGKPIQASNSKTAYGAKEKTVQEANVPGNEQSRERIVLRTKVPGNGWSRERMFQGTNRLITNILVTMNDYEHHSSVTAMKKHLEWPTLEHRREIQCLTMMFKVVRGLVAVPSTQLILLLIKRTTANHQFKYRDILTNSTPYKFSFFPRTIPSYGHGTSYQLRRSTLQHSTRSTERCR